MIQSGALRITLLYILLGVLWITLSDQFLTLVDLPADSVRFTQTVKGWAFVGITGLLLYVLVLRYGKTLERAEASERQAKDLLGREGVYYRTLVENSYDIVAVLDAEAMIRFVSPSVTKTLATTPRSSLGKTCSIMYRRRTKKRPPVYCAN